MEDKFMKHLESDGNLQHSQAYSPARLVSGVMADVLFYAASDYLHIFLT